MPGHARRPAVVGIEGGGTKFVCAVGTGPDDLRAHARFPTTTPEATLEQVAAFVDEQRRSAPIAAVGIGSFGPLELDPAATAFGHLRRSTPKVGWEGFDLVGWVQRRLGLPVALATDVQAAGLAEARWGAARDARTAVYVTVGTGIGGAVVVDGEPLDRRRHAELGHLSVPRHPDDDHPGRCPRHGDCLEGLAAGPAIADRWGAPAEQLPDAELAAARELEAWYLGHLVTTLHYLVSPDRIVLGGGVCDLPGLLPAVRAAAVRQLAGYAPPDDLDAVVTAPGLGGRAGVIGAIALAMAALEEPAAYG